MTVPTLRASAFLIALSLILSFSVLLLLVNKIVTRCVNLLLLLIRCVATASTDKPRYKTEV